jgi:nicotinamidase-related amidase
VDDKTALVVIDTQRGMFETPGVPPVPDGERLPGSIEGLIERAREAGTTVIHIRRDGGPGQALERGTGRGWPIHPRVAPAAGEPVVDKEASDSSLHTTLRDELDTRGMARQVLAGMQTEYCVDTACRRAFGLGYDDVTLTADARGTRDEETLIAAQIIAHHNEVMGNGFAAAPPAEISFREPVSA